MSHITVNELAVAGKADSVMPFDAFAYGSEP